MRRSKFQNGNCWYATRLFSQEWPAKAGRQIKELRDTENERVRKRLKRKDEKSVL